LLNRINAYNIGGSKIKVIIIRRGRVYEVI